MILIEPEVMEKLKKDNTNTSVNSLSHLDEEMNKVLKTKLEDREKWSLYLQTLQRYLYFIGKDRKPIEIPLINLDRSEGNIKENVKPEQSVDVNREFIKTHENLTGENIQVNNNDLFVKSQLLQLIPKSYKLKSELLIDVLLKNKDKIHWNDKGTVFINNKEVQKSNIVDLLNDVVRPLKNSSPHGWVEFTTALKDLHIPISYIGNPKRATYINLMSKTPDFGKRFEITTESFSTPDFSTPQSKVKVNQAKAKRKLDWERWNPY